MLTVWQDYEFKGDVLEWLRSNHYDTNSELISLVKEWASHWGDRWSYDWSKHQLERVGIIGDWIEEHSGNRQWATALMTPII